MENLDPTLHPEMVRRGFIIQGKRETEREASVRDVLARSYLRVGEYKQSIEYGKKALSIARYGIILRFWEMPTYPSTKPTLTLSSYLGHNVGLGEG